MRHWRMVVVLLTALLVPTVAMAAAAGKVVIAQGVDPTTLDMMNQAEQPASNVGAQMYESLLERDQSLKLVPALAAEMPKLVAPTTWEFKLRKGVKFHNGEEFTAESVKFSIERLINPANKLRGSSTFASSPTGAGGGGPPTPGPVTVHVVGQVRRPGVVQLPAGSRVADALAKAIHLASLAGATLGPVVSLSESADGGHFAEAAMVRSAKADMALEPGEQRVGATVTASWELDLG